MVEFLIETSIDKLISLLRKKKRITISELAKILNVPLKQVDEWVFILEDKGLVDIKYPVFGEPEVAIREIKPEQLEEENEKEIVIETRIIPGKPIKRRLISRPKDEAKQRSKKDYTEFVEEIKTLEDKFQKISKKNNRDKKMHETEKDILKKIKYIEKKLDEENKKKKGSK